MKMLRFSVCFSALATSALASIPAGRGEISLEAEVMGTYDSNVQGRHHSQEDYYATFAPRVTYSRRAGQIGADLGVGISSERYGDSKQYNSDNVTANADLILSEKSFQNVSGSLTGSYIESYNVDQDLNTRIKAHATTVNTDVGITTGARTHLDAKASYTNTERAGLIGSDQRFLEGGLDFGVSDVLVGTGLNFSYDYTRATTSGQNALGASIDQEAHLFSFGLSRPVYHDVTGRVNYGYRVLNRSAAETTTGKTRQTGTVLSATLQGPFLPPSRFPKIKSHLALSYESAATPGVNDPGTSKAFTGDLGLTWTARETTSISITASRAQRLSSNDLSVITTTTLLAIEQKLGYNLSGTIDGGYTWNSYRTVARADKVLLADASLSYAFGHSSWNAAASYRFQTSSSNTLVSDYERHVATVSVGYHY